MTAPGVVSPPGPGWWVKRNRVIFPPDPTLVLSGAVPTIRLGPKVIPTGAGLTLTGGTPIVRNGNVLRPTGVTLVLTGRVPTVTVAAAAAGFPYTFPIYFAT